MFEVMEWDYFYFDLVDWNDFKVWMDVGFVDVWMWVWEKVKIIFVEYYFVYLMFE